MNYALGCDISRWQDDPTTPERVDFNQMVRGGASFVFLKASQSTWKDSTFDYHWKASKEAGLLRGAYHFLTWDNPIAQADFFSDLLAADQGELPPIADFEWWSVTPPNALDILAVFLERVNHNLKDTIGIYTSIGFWKPHGSTAGAWAHYPLWLAYWSSFKPTAPKPWTRWEFWQFTNKGGGYGFGVESQQIDLNYFNGSVEDLYTKYSTPDYTPPLTDAQKLAILWENHMDLWSPS